MASGESARHWSWRLAIAGVTCACSAVEAPLGPPAPRQALLGVGEAACVVRNVQDGRPFAIISTSSPRRAGGRQEPNAIAALDYVDGHVVAISAGEWVEGEYGRALCAIPDLDGDGIEEIAAGAPGASRPGLERCGRLAILSGRDLTGIADRWGTQSGEELGARISFTTVGDRDHLLVVSGMGSAPRRVTAVALQDLRFAWEAPGAPAEGWYGAVAIAVPDLDGDSVHDVAVGVPLDAREGGSTGSIVLLSGRDGARIGKVWGDQHGAMFGAAACLVGLSGEDGRPRICVGSPRYSNAVGEVGKVQVLTLPDGRTEWERCGDKVGAWWGATVAVRSLRLVDGSTTHRLLVACPLWQERLAISGRVEEFLLPTFETARQYEGRRGKCSLGLRMASREWPATMPGSDVILCAPRGVAWASGSAKGSHGFIAVLDGEDREQVRVFHDGIEATAAEVAEFIVADR